MIYRIGKRRLYEDARKNGSANGGDAGGRVICATMRMGATTL